MKTKNYWVKWIHAAGIRAVKTAAQTALAGITVGAAMADVNWIMVLSTAGAAAIASLLTSLTGLPEVKLEEVE